MGQLTCRVIEDQRGYGGGMQAGDTRFADGMGYSQYYMMMEIWGEECSLYMHP